MNAHAILTQVYPKLVQQVGVRRVRGWVEGGALKSTPEFREGLDLHDRVYFKELEAHRVELAKARKKAQWVQEQMRRVEVCVKDGSVIKYEEATDQFFVKEPEVAEYILLRFTTSKDGIEFVDDSPLEGGPAEAEYPTEDDEEWTQEVVETPTGREVHGKRGSETGIIMDRVAMDAIAVEVEKVAENSANLEARIVKMGRAVVQGDTDLFVVVQATEEGHLHADGEARSRKNATTSARRRGAKSASDAFYVVGTDGIVKVY